MRERVVVMAIVVGLALCLAAIDAQEKPAANVAPTNGAAVVVPPVVPDELKRGVTETQVRVAGLSYAIATLQKELDATTVSLQRTIQQAQAACTATKGYTLAQTLTCVKEPEPEAPAKK